MSNHLAVNNTKSINQNCGDNLKPEVGNSNEPKVLDSNNTLDLRNERNNIKIHSGEYPGFNKKIIKLQHKEQQI